MSVMFAAFTLFISTFYFTKYGGQWMFLIWVCCMYFCVGAGASLIPTYTSECFGYKHFGSNYGLVFTNFSIIFFQV